MSKHSLAPSEVSRQERCQAIASILSGSGQMLAALRAQQSGVGGTRALQAEACVSQLLHEALAQGFAGEPILDQKGRLWRSGQPPAEPLTQWQQLCQLQGVWILHPLEGKLNYLAGLEHYAICLAWMELGQLQLAGVYLPSSCELFLAGRGEGAFCKGQRLELARSLRGSKALVALEVEGEAPLPYSELQLPHLCWRQLGSTTSSLVKLAQGQFDGCWMIQSSFCEVAAALLIVEEAGGQLFAEKPSSCLFERGHLIAASAPLISLLTSYLQGSHERVGF